MGSNESKLHENIGKDLLTKNESMFRTDLRDLSSPSVFLKISRNLGLALKMLPDWTPTVLHLVVHLSLPDYLTISANVLPGQDFNVFDNYGLTPLMLAVERQYKEIVELLLVNGADPSVKSSKRNGETALHYACQKGGMEIALMVFKNVKEIDVRSAEGITPLMSAVMQKHEEVAEWLVSQGADPFLTDKHSQNCMDLASKAGWTEEDIEKISRRLMPKATA